MCQLQFRLEGQRSELARVVDVEMKMLLRSMRTARMNTMIRKRKTNNTEINTSYDPWPLFGDYPLKSTWWCWSPASDPESDIFLSLYPDLPSKYFQKSRTYRFKTVPKRKASRQNLQNMTLLRTRNSEKRRRSRWRQKIHMWTKSSECRLAEQQVASRAVGRSFGCTIR